MLRGFTRAFERLCSRRSACNELNYALREEDALSSFSRSAETEALDFAIGGQLVSRCAANSKVRFQCTEIEHWRQRCDCERGGGRLRIQHGAQLYIAPSHSVMGVNGEP